MKKEYKTPLTEVVFLSIGQLLQEAQAGNTDSEGNSEDWYNNSATFEQEEETTSNFQGGRSLWED